jgi:flagellar protein FliS
MFSTPFASNTSRAKRFTGAYQQVGVQTMVASASPHGLVALLFDGFIATVHRAKGAMRRRDIADKGQAIGDALQIIDEGLKSGLNLKGGGRLATDLSDLYAYICLRLTQANLHNDESALDECLTLISPLREAWQAIGPRVDAPANDA